MTIQDIAGKYKQLVIVGCGNIGSFLLKEIQINDVNCEVCFCDNNEAKWGTYEGYDVLSYENAVKRYPNARYIIAALGFIHSMKKQLISLGVDERNILEEEIQDYLHELEEKYRTERKMSITPMLRMEVSLAEHCNLNCKYCAHFSSIAEPQFMDIVQYDKDMKRMSELLGGKSGIIYLLGGEPLLYDKLEQCFQITRSNFEQSRIILLTNGLLINRMSKSFFEACKKNKIVICITKYPIKFDYESVIEKLRQEKIEFDYMRMSDDECCFSKYVLDLEGKQDAHDSFIHCNMANQCHLLREGKLYTCSVIGCIQHFNKYYGKNLAVTESDYVDIYQVKSTEDMLKRLASPASFCKYCNVKNRIDGLPFEISKKDIEEWI